MNKTAFKILLKCAAIAALIALILLMLNGIGAIYILQDANSAYTTSVKEFLRGISDAYLKGDASGYPLPEGWWCILLSDGGDVIFDINMPADIPRHYGIQDIARYSHWYISDYPVNMWTSESGLFILGQPKNTVAKYEYLLSAKSMERMPARLGLVLLLNILLALGLSAALGLSLYRSIKKLTIGIDELSEEKNVKLSGGGIFTETYRRINRCSEDLARKNRLLSEKEAARKAWVRGISHDIRTPLAIIMGNSESIAASANADNETRQYAERIIHQSRRIGKLVEDLNLISMLQWDMQPLKKKNEKLGPMIRSVVTDIMNGGIAESFHIAIEPNETCVEVQIDRALMERALYNLINNSLKHNPNGCDISIRQRLNGSSVLVEISDNGCGIPEAVLRNITVLPESAHGLGLPMAYRIITAHGGSMTIQNHGGAVIRIALPCASRNDETGAARKS